MLLDRLRNDGFDIKFVSHAAAILEGDFPSALEELEQVLLNVRVPIEEIIGSGGGESQGTQRMRPAVNVLDWTNPNCGNKGRPMEVCYESQASTSC